MIKEEEVSLLWPAICVDLVKFARVDQLRAVVQDVWTLQRDTSENNAPVNSNNNKQATKSANKQPTLKQAAQRT